MWGTKFIRISPTNLEHMFSCLDIWDKMQSYWAFFFLTQIVCCACNAKEIEKFCISRSLSALSTMKNP